MAKRNPKADEKLLKEIRDSYDYASAYWRPIYEQGDIDMRYVAGDPWDPKDRKEREDNGRPCISHDEINQYLLQAMNQVRQNPRGIKCNPAGNGATNKTAEFCEDHIRAIEYRSKAWRCAYLPAYENALQRSYGFFRVTREVVGQGFDQELRIKGILNPSTVLFDPDAKEADWSDADFCFVQDKIRRKDFSRKYPKAEKTSFSDADMREAKAWIRPDHIVVAEYWKAKKKTRTLLLVGDKENPRTVYEDELETSRDKAKVLQDREVETRTICQYITNGVEILEELEAPGTLLPIIAVIGRELYLNEGSETKRKLISMTRLARDPQMSHAFYCSQEAEEAGLTPKVPFIGAVGQFETDKDTWEEINKVPHAFVQYDVIVDSANAPLPAPTRPQFQPNFQAYEVAKESARRAIQAAMGISPLPSSAQRQNEKSGIALQQIGTSEAIGSFHFTDNLNRALELAGRVYLEYRKVVYDTARDVVLRGADESHRTVKINTAEPYSDETGKDQQYTVSQGDHDPDITTGPSFESQRDEAADFAETIIKNIEQLPIDPVTKSKFLALIIRLRNLGPLGDEMAELLDPEQNSPQAVHAQLAQSMSKLQQQGLALKEMQGELQKLQLEKAGKVVENQTKVAIAKMQHDLEIAKLDNQRAIAEIQTKAQIATERAQQLHEVEVELHGAAHEIALQKDQQQHDKDLAQQNAEAAQAQAALQPQPEAGQ